MCVCERKDRARERCWCITMRNILYVQSSYPEFSTTYKHSVQIGFGKGKSLSDYRTHLNYVLPSCLWHNTLGNIDTFVLYIDDFTHSHSQWRGVNNFSPTIITFSLTSWRLSLLHVRGHGIWHIKLTDVRQNYVDQSQVNQAVSSLTCTCLRRAGVKTF